MDVPIRVQYRALGVVQEDVRVVRVVPERVPAHARVARVVPEDVQLVAIQVAGQIARMIVRFPVWEDAKQHANMAQPVVELEVKT